MGKKTWIQLAAVQDHVQLQVECRQDTGGTCFWWNCSELRDQVACNTAWYMCLRKEGTCSTRNGTCVNQNSHLLQPAGRVTAYVREKVLSLALAAPMAYFLRADLFIPVASYLGNRMLLCGDTVLEKLEFEEI